MGFLIPVFDTLKKAQEKLAGHTRAQKDAALLAAANAVDQGRDLIIKANACDIEKARQAGQREALVDRLLLNDARIDDIIKGIKTTAALDDPIGRVLSGWKTPNGLLIEKTCVPLGVVAIIYESRPNVTADAAAIAYKAGCAILLRGSRAALESNRALYSAIRAGLKTGGGEADAVALCDPGENAQGHKDVEEILRARGFIDAVLPRGGHDLIREVVTNARVPVIETGEGNCHIYVDESADLVQALAIVENAKLQKPGACNAVETVLVHKTVLFDFMALLVSSFAGRVELRCDPAAYNAAAGAGRRLKSGETPPDHFGLVCKEAAEEDWETEFLDYILAVKTVQSLDEAVEHINRYGTKHSEAILTGNLKSAEEFCRRVDAACVYINASTRFTDGGQFGFGAELGISTQKFHVRGPMGLDALTAIKYRISGQGQIRE